jgi:ketosteroid isomerase-like protein
MGHYRLIQNDGSTADTGQYIVIWKETGAGWKVYREIWNSDVPSAAPAAEIPVPAK